MTVGRCVTKRGQNKALQIQEDIDVGVNSTGGHPAMDYAEHNRTYAAFLRYTKVGIISCVVLLAGMYFFLV